ncbi:hypothetical protein HXZ66_01115 [Bacillus sp. A116_S68]|nr:hypothetical protein HXZ66_01110 [Bacillus sp. A116_S68]UJW56114.1 hypothetical protein HXZ66_01115 [Bacillus sp. A116_S68]
MDLVLHLAEKTFLQYETAKNVVDLVMNGASIATIIGLAGATMGWGLLWVPLIRGAAAKWGARRAAIW